MKGCGAQDFRVQGCYLVSAGQGHGAFKFGGDQFEHRSRALRPFGGKPVQQRTPEKHALCPKGKRLGDVQSAAKAAVGKYRDAPIHRLEDSIQCADRRNRAVKLTAAVIGNDQSIDPRGARFCSVSRMQNPLDQQGPVPQPPQPGKTLPGQAALHLAAEQRRLQLQGVSAFLFGQIDESGHAAGHKTHQPGGMERQIEEGGRRRFERQAEAVADIPLAIPADRHVHREYKGPIAGQPSAPDHLLGNTALAHHVELQPIQRRVRLCHGLYPCIRRRRQHERDALIGIGNAIEEIQSFDPRTDSRIFSIAMTDIGSLYFLPSLEADFQEKAPRIGIEIRQVQVDEIVDQLASGRLDAAVGNLPSLRGQTRSAVIFREHYVCLMGKEQALAIGEMTMDTFLASRHVAVSSTYSGHRLAEDALQDLGISRRIVVRTPYYTALPLLISNSDLIVLLPSRIARIFASQTEVVALPAPMELPEFDVRMHWHPRHETNPALNWLLERIAAVGRTL